MFINFAPLAMTVEKLRTGRMDLIAHVDEMCDRLEKLDSHIKAMLPEPERRSRLRSEVKSLQARYPDPANRPPLYGALVAVKDIFHVSGFVTAAGSVIPPELFAGPEATSVQMLRDAGAIILGKSVTTEFAYFEPGPTRNPHNLSHTPGGSSSGSAAAVAAGLCTLSLGSQTIGSVIRPAAFCGVIGFKPSLYRDSDSGPRLFLTNHGPDRVLHAGPGRHGISRVSALRAMEACFCAGDPACLGSPHRPLPATGRAWKGCRHSSSTCQSWKRWVASLEECLPCPTSGNLILFTGD